MWQMRVQKPPYLADYTPGPQEAWLITQAFLAILGQRVQEFHLFQKVVSVL